MSDEAIVEPLRARRPPGDGGALPAIEHALSEAALAHSDATFARHGLAAHEQLCALRYSELGNRIGRLERILIGAVGFLLTGMGGLIATLLARGH